MEAGKLAPISEHLRNEGQDAANSANAFQIAIERNRALCGIGQPNADVWVAPSEEIHQRFLSRQPRVRPRLESRPSFPEAWAIGQNEKSKEAFEANQVARPSNPVSPQLEDISPKSPASPKPLQQPDSSPFFPLSPKRPPNTRKPYSESDLSLRRYKTNYTKNVRVITEMEWAAALEENHRIRAELDGFRVRFNSVVQANDLKEARLKSDKAKKSPWRKTKGFFQNLAKRFLAPKP